MAAQPKLGSDGGGQVKMSKSVFGSFDDSDVIVWLKRLALNPCNTIPASEKSAKTLWNRTLMLRKFLNLSSAECPQRKRKLQQFLSSDEFKAASGFSSAPFTYQSVKQLGTTNFHSVDSSKCSRIQTVLNSCSSGSLFTFEAGSQPKDHPIFSSLDDAASWGPSNGDVYPLVDTDESVNRSNPLSPGKMIIEDASLMDSDDPVHGSDLLIPRKKIHQSFIFPKSEDRSRPAIPIGSSFQAEVPEWTESANQVVYRKVHSRKSKVIVEGALVEGSDDLVHSSDSSSSKQKVRLSARFLKTRYLSRPVIPIGPRFQAEIPEWTGPDSQASYLDGDSETLKWLGTRIWPMEDETTQNVVLPIGKGRSNSCSCLSRGSAECIKRHVLEEYLRIRSNLGPAFLSWKFNNMGEVVSQSWTVKQQKTFESLMKRNPFSNQTSFLELSLKYFPSKSQKNVVSYYYNVYIPRRMSQLTRLSFKEVDSDEEQVSGEDVIDDADDRDIEGSIA